MNLVKDPLAAPAGPLHKIVAREARMGDTSLPVQLDPQGLKRLYRDHLKSVLLSATPEQRMQILAREHAALTRKDASPTDETDRADRYSQLIRGVFDREDLTEEHIQLAVSNEAPSLALPAASATEAQPVAQESAVVNSTAGAPPIPSFVRQREDEAPQLPEQAPWLLPEDEAASAARLKEFQEHVKRDLQDAATRPSLSEPLKANDEPEHTSPKRPGRPKRIPVYGQKIAPLRGDLKQEDFANGVASL
jgi:hypothetical protein